jgi:uncharacterized protein YigA (DUF484 family)
MADRDTAPRKDTAGLTAQEVESYLRDHADFLIDHPDLMNLLLPPEARHGDRVVDMQTFMLKRVRGDLSKLQSQQNEILATTRSNLTSQNRIHAGVVRMLEARTLEELIEIITTDLAVHLDVDAVILAFEAIDRLPHSSNRSTLRLLSRGAVDRLLGGGGKDMLLQADIVADQQLYGGAATLVRSQALMKLELRRDAPMGLIAFGSRQPGKFHPGQGTELLTFLAKVVELTLRGWLDRS